MSKRSERIDSPTRTARVNVSITAALVLLLLVIVFVAQNPASVSIKFVGWNGHISLGLALLIGAVAGGLVVTLFGFARIVQLRHRARRSAKHDDDRVVDVTNPASSLDTKDTTVSSI